MKADPSAKHWSLSDGSDRSLAPADQFSLPASQLLGVLRLDPLVPGHDRSPRAVTSLLGHGTTAPVGLLRLLGLVSRLDSQLVDLAGRVGLEHGVDQADVEVGLERLEDLENAVARTGVELELGADADGARLEVHSGDVPVLDGLQDGLAGCLGARSHASPPSC